MISASLLNATGVVQSRARSGTCKRVILRPRASSAAEVPQQGAQPAGEVTHPATVRRRALIASAGVSCFTLRARPAEAKSEAREGKIAHSDKEWLEILGKDSYRIVREAGTERPFSSPLEKEKRPGTFLCAGCASPLFDASTKFDSGTGWPSFNNAIPGAVREVGDNSIIFLPRSEVRCQACEGHLGHVFTDGPPPSGLRYCMNGLSLRFKPATAA